MAEKEYIEREATIGKLNRLCDRVCQYSKAQRKYMCGACPLGDAFTVIEDDIPAADVRPVVLCRDCKYNRGTKTWIDNDVTADCTNGHGYPPLDWFCADGERPNCGADMRNAND